ncbi:predicted protein [Uncinocarpus reesii 1704]|uniref:Uncharacterized protein n=1 Tax=Uncinocarpus reesii (strain UAMH 1704) TaxID=336963 RepID=C4JEK9_UNCRE|nr:uncharacterized protein UREG_00848 [Uncinocarpus reesii 1704]EEP76001.1 predicted protein [Uncinocarpus reesii 1704]
MSFTRPIVAMMGPSGAGPEPEPQFSRPLRGPDRSEKSAMTLMRNLRCYNKMADILSEFHKDLCCEDPVDAGPEGRNEERYGPGIFLFWGLN